LIVKVRSEAVSVLALGSPIAAGVRVLSEVDQIASYLRSRWVPHRS